MFVILEGRFGALSVEGNRHHSTPFIERHLQRVVASGVVREEPLERGLLVLNDYTGLRLQSALVPGKAIGTTDLVLKVKDRRHRGRRRVRADHQRGGAASIGIVRRWAVRSSPIARLSGATCPSSD